MLLFRGIYIYDSSRCILPIDIPIDIIAPPGPLDRGDTEFIPSATLLSRNSLLNLRFLVLILWIYPYLVLPVSSYSYVVLILWIYSYGN